MGTARELRGVVEALEEEVPGFSDDTGCVLRRLDGEYQSLPVSRIAEDMERLADGSFAEYDWKIGCDEERAVLWRDGEGFIYAATGTWSGTVDDPADAEWVLPIYFEQVPPGELDDVLASAYGT